MDNIERTKSKGVCFTGHREMYHSESAVRETVRETVEELAGKGYLYFYAGGARGFDTIAAEAVLEVKERYPEIQLILALPFQNQYAHEEGWTKDEKKRYHELKRKAQDVVLVSSEYKKGAYFARNRYLADHASVCVAYQMRGRGGTAYTVDYARSKHLEIISIPDRI